jgi:hypothetical protein
LLHLAARRRVIGLGELTSMDAILEPRRVSTRTYDRRPVAEEVQRSAGDGQEVVDVVDAAGHPGGVDHRVVLGFLAGDGVGP